MALPALIQLTRRDSYRSFDPDGGTGRPQICAI